MNERDSLGFAQQLALVGASGSYSARISEFWSQGRAAFGGLVAALLARALEQVVPADRTLRSALIDFIAPVAPGNVTLQANVLRAGKSLVHAEARMLQAGQPVALFVGTYGVARTTQLTLAGPRPSSGEPPSSLPRLPYLEGVLPRFTQFFDFRVATGQPFAGSSEGKIAGYVCHAQPTAPDCASILALIDAWPPAVLPLLTKPAPASSVTWMVDIVGQLPAAAPAAQEFYRYESMALAASGGYASCEARLWQPDGTLLAASRQLVAEFS